MPDLKRRFQDVMKRLKNWLPPVALVFGIIAAFFYVGTELWRSFQDGNLNTLPAILVLIAVCLPIFYLAQSYWRVVLVAIAGMVIGTVAGVFPYLVIVIIMILLELSPEGQTTSRELSQLLSNDLFGQLFFVAGAASGGPIAVYVYIEEKKSDAEKNEDQ